MCANFILPCGENHYGFFLRCPTSFYNQPTKKSAEVIKKDYFEHTLPEKQIVYTKNKLNDMQIQQLEREHQKRMENFRKMLQSMLVKQGEKSNLLLLEERLNVTAMDSMKAAASISEGGEYSVEAVATRILDMAKALSGGDASKIPELRSAVEEGFRAAGMELGGSLPEICQDTYMQVMKSFDEWEKEMLTESV